MLTRRSYLLPHPVVFISDPTNLKNLVVPELHPAIATSTNNTCIAVRAIADVDGEVTVVVDARVPDDAKDAIMVFSGELDTPGRRVTMMTSEMEVLLDRAVSGTRSRVQVFIDDYRFPARVWAVVS